MPLETISYGPMVLWFLREGYPRHVEAASGWRWPLERLERAAGWQVHRSGAARQGLAKASSRFCRAEGFPGGKSTTKHSNNGLDSRHISIPAGCPLVLMFDSDGIIPVGLLDDTLTSVKRMLGSGRGLLLFASKLQ